MKEPVTPSQKQLIRLLIQQCLYEAKQEAEKAKADNQKGKGRSDD